MFRLPTASDSRPAPLSPDERTEAVRDALKAEGAFPRRMAHASTTGLTITYAHLSTTGEAREAARILAAALDWSETEVTWVSGSAVAVTTSRG